MNEERWQGPFSREKSISLIMHENRFWPFSRFWDLGYAWNCTGILSKRFSSTLHKLLSQQKSESALFRILTTSICVKSHFSRLWRVWKGYDCIQILDSMVFFESAYVAESAKTWKCVILYIVDVNMCKNSLSLTLTGLEGLGWSGRAMIAFRC